ncbi:MAG: hypothetical protein L0Y55_13145 [Anaerolineales bacterium]|nr:hypothetical protein [Anaerolineales bacterium]
MKNELRLTDLDTAREAGFVKQVKAALDLPGDAQLQLKNIARDARGAVVEYVVTLPIRIVGAEFGAANGVTVDERVDALLRFDANGARVLSQVSPLDERHLRLTKDNLRKLAASNAIYLAAPDETIDPDALRAQRKSWYVETDAQGHKRLKRALMA